MAWTYSTWRSLPETTTAQAAAKLAQLSLHIVEVSDAITADVSSGGKSRSSGSLTEYLGRLEAEEKRLRGKGAARAAYPRRG